MSDLRPNRTPWMVKVFLPFWFGGYSVGMTVGIACGNQAVGMSLGMAVGSVAALVVGLIWHSDEFRRRRPSPPNRP